MKSFLRSQKLLERLEHHPQEKFLKDETILQNLLHLEFFQNAKIILLYLPIHGEVDVRKLFSEVPQKKYVLPRVNDKVLDLYFIDDIESVEEGRFGLLEPQPYLPKANFSDIDLILVPGIVFAEDGHRIGFGKGFYDRLLKKVSCPKIGIAYEFQIVKNIGQESHDVPMDVIVTEKRVLNP